MAQNKLLRFLNNTKISDQISTKSILDNLNMLSVNQINAQVKLTEMWKMDNIKDYPMQIKRLETLNGARTTRAVTSGTLVEQGISNLATSTYINDSARIWNKAPLSIKECKTLMSAKKAIKTFVKTLPV